MPNRLANETSPYLQQHANNPVDWHPWGPEAFAKARREGKPILLSVGYAACHWCHVMERESFEDEAIAGLMNQLFDLDDGSLNALELLISRLRKKLAGSTVDIITVRGVGYQARSHEPG